MDPISAVGIAAAVIQFVTFTGTLVSGAYELHYRREGKKRWVLQLTDLTTSLVEIKDNICAIQPKNTHETLCPRDNDIVSLCKACNRIADRFLSVLDTIRSKKAKSQAKLWRKPWNNFRGVLLELWKRSEIEALEKELDSFRELISLYLLASIRLVILLPRLADDT